MPLYTMGKKSWVTQNYNGRDKTLEIIFKSGWVILILWDTILYLSSTL